jgi:hypothetical protein
MAGHVWSFLLHFPGALLGSSSRLKLLNFYCQILRIIVITRYLWTMVALMLIVCIEFNHCQQVQVWSFPSYMIGLLGVDKFMRQKLFYSENKCITEWWNQNTSKGSLKSVILVKISWYWLRHALTVHRRKLLRDITHINSTIYLCWQSNKEDREAHCLT